VTLPPELLKGAGWVPFQVWGVVEWCGHRVEGLPVPTSTGPTPQPKTEEKTEE
jgi:hypothetical protein